MAEYDYDDAGNRKPARESGGGTVSGGNYSHPLLTANYPANALSQYSGIASPQQFDVPGRRAVGGVGGNTVNIDISSQNVGSPAGAGYQPNRGNCYAKRIANYIAHMNRRFFSSLLISLPVGSIACKENVKTDICLLYTSPSPRD